MTHDLQKLERLITFLPYNLVEEVVVDGIRLEPRVRWEEGCLLSAELSLVAPRTPRTESIHEDEQVARGAELTLALRRILEDAVFPRGGYLLKFSDAGVLVMFTRRCPGAAGWSSAEHALEAGRAARCGLELLQSLKTVLPNRFTLRAGVEMGRFRLALCGRPEERLEQLALGSLCKTVSQLRASAGPGELVAGPNLIGALSGLDAHVGPRRGTGRRLMNMPAESAGEPLRIVDLRSLLMQAPRRHLEQLRVLMPSAIRGRVEDAQTLTDGSEVRPITVAAFPLDVDVPDDADDDAVLLDVGGGVQRLLDAVEQNGGQLLHLDVLGGGSAAVAAFGVGDTQKRAARSAVECALMLARRMGSKRTSWTMRAGLETGRAYLGEIGSPLKRELAVVGGAAVVALDLARQATPGQVLVGEQAWRLCSPLISGRSRGELVVGSPPQSYPVFEAAAIQSESEAVAPAPNEATTDESPVDGMQRVRDRIERLMEQTAATGQGGTAVVQGETGSGKSALLSSLSDDAAREGFRGAALRCPRQPAEHDLPAHVPLLREALGLPRGTTTQHMVTATLDLLAECVASGITAPALFWQWLGLPPPVVTAGTQYADAWEVMARVLVYRAEQAPLFLLVEDVHHAVDATLRLLLRLMQLAQRSPLVMLISMTHEATAPLPDRVRDVLRRGGARWLEMPRLTADEAQALLCHDLGVPDVGWLEVAPAVLAAGIEHAQGLPSTLHGMADLARLRMQQGRAFSQAWVEAQESPTVDELAQLKLDALPVALRELTRVASILGMEFEALLLWKTMEGTDGAGTLTEVMARLGRLTTSGILSSTLVAGSVGYRFRASSVRDVAYAGLAPDVRARWHARAGDALMRVPASQVSCPPGRLAYHFALGGLTARALAACSDAAVHLDQHGQPAVARTVLLRAQELAEANPAQRRTVDLQLARVALRLGRLDEADNVASGIADDATAPAPLRAQAWWLRGTAALLRGDPGGASLAAAAGRKVLPKNTQLGDRTRLRALHVDSNWQEGQAERALLFVEQMLVAPEIAGLVKDRSVSSGDVALDQGFLELCVAHAGALHAVGRTPEAVNLLEATVKDAQALSQPAHAARAHLRLGEILMEREPAAAVTSLRLAVDTLDVEGEALLTVRARLHLARALLRRGDPDGARAVLEILLVGECAAPALRALLLAVEAQALAVLEPAAARTRAQSAEPLLASTKGRDRVLGHLELARAYDALGMEREQALHHDQARRTAQASKAQDLVAALDAEDTMRS